LVRLSVAGVLRERKDVVVEVDRARRGDLFCWSGQEEPAAGAQAVTDGADGKPHFHPGGAESVVDLFVELIDDFGWRSRLSLLRNRAFAPRVSSLPCPKTVDVRYVAGGDRLLIGGALMGAATVMMAALAERPCRRAPKPRVSSSMVGLVEPGEMAPSNADDDFATAQPIG
jgi:hypothetical protein